MAIRRYAQGTVVLTSLLLGAAWVIGTVIQAAPPTLSGGGPGDGQTDVPLDAVVDIVSDRALASVSAAGWSSVQTGLGTQNADSVFFLNATTGWVPLRNGQILRTTDGGATWATATFQTGLPSASLVVDVHAVDANTVWLASNTYGSNTIWKSTDGGATWAQQTSTTNLKSVRMASATNGLAVGLVGKILRTTDGGATWVTIATGIVNGLNTVRFADTSTGIVAGTSGKILQTTDGGATWSTKTSGTAQALNGASFANATTGWVVGNAGVILKTTDSGATWASQTSGVAVVLNAVYAADANTAWAVGASGTVRKTTDGGATWASQTVTAAGSVFTIRSVHFIDASTGLAVVSNASTSSGAFIVRTTDGGANWSVVGFSGGFLDVTFADANTGWASSGFGSVFKTTDAGAAWAPTAVSTSQAYSGVGFASATTGWMVGGATTAIIQATTDGGSTWTSQTSTAQNLNSVAAIDTSTVVAVGGLGNIVKTTNGGTNWTTVLGNTNYSGAFATANIGWIGSTGGIVRKTTDGGVTWTGQPTGITETMTVIHAIDTSTVTAGTADGTILRSTDGGATWTSVVSGTTQSLSSIAFANATTGWIVGGSGNNASSGVIRKTTDGGATWATQTSGTTEQLNVVRFFDANTGWVGGNAGVLLKTTDGGATWSALTSGVANGFTGFAAFDASNVVAVGSSGMIRKTTDGGTNWSSISSPTVQEINDVRFVDANTGWLTVATGAIHKSTDGGATWVSQWSVGTPDLECLMALDANTVFVCGTGGAVLKTVDGGTTWTTSVPTLRRVTFLNANTGWAVGDSGNIWKTTNGGTDWLNQPSGTTQRLSGAAFVDANTGWVVGDSGTILATTNGGATWTAQTSGTSEALRTVRTPQAGTAWAGGAIGTILATTNGGATWTAQTSGVTELIVAMTSSSATAAVAVGSSGSIIRTTNGGGSTALVFLQANAGNTSAGAPTGANRCTSTALSADSSGNASRRIVCTHARLSPSTWYSFTVRGGANWIQSTDGSSNTMSADVVRVFRTSSVDPGANTTPPVVVSVTVVEYGASGFPTNGKIRVYFSTGPEGAMATSGAGSITDAANVVLQTVSGGAPTGPNLCASGGCTLTWTAASRMLTVTPTSPLSASSDYAITIKSTTKNTADQTLTADRRVPFRTGSGVDTTAPTVRSTTPVTVIAPTAPSGAATGVSTQTSEIALQFSEPMDPTTLTSSTVRFCRESGGDGICDDGELVTESSLSRRYDPVVQRYQIGLRSLLQVGNRYCVQLPAAPSSVQDANGVASGGTAYCFTTQSSYADATPPTILFGQADPFKLSLSFSEPMNATAAETCANYTIDVVGGAQLSTSSATCTYKSESRSVEIVGLGVPPNAQWRVTGSASLTDLSSNAMVVNGTTNVAAGITLSPQVSGGFLGPSDGSFPDFHMSTNFASFWEKPQRCAPRTKLAGKSAVFDCEITVPSALTTGAKLLLTFPSGSDVTNAAAVATTDSQVNRDVNGPAPGTTTISGVTANPSANTVTITLAHAGTVMGSSDQLRFELSGITMPSSAATEARVSIIVKDADGIQRGSAITAAPFTITAAGSYAISGSVFVDVDGDRAPDAGEGVSGITVQLRGMSGGGGREDATSGADGSYTFTGLSAGTYQVLLAPFMSGNYTTTGTAQTVTLTNAAQSGVHFLLTNLASNGGKTLAVTVNGGASLGDADSTADVDLFCFAPLSAAFSVPIFRAVDLDASGNATATLPLQGGQTYECGAGPAMPRTTTGTMSTPTFRFVPPRSVTVSVPAASNPTPITFTLTAASQQVVGVVRDNAGTGIANAFIGARVVSAFDATTGDRKDVRGSSAQSSTDGTFTLNVTPGTYLIGACASGMPCGAEQEVSVRANSSNADGNSAADVYQGATLVTSPGLILTLAKSSTTVSGTVRDENGTEITSAVVRGERITAGGTCTSFTPAGGHAESPVDSSGLYTLYVAEGTWRIAAFSPAYGQIGCTVISVASGSSQTEQDLQASSSGFGTIAGTVTRASATVEGAIIACTGSAGANMTRSGADGTYALKLPAGSGYTCDGRLPGSGSLPQRTGQTVTANTTATLDFDLGNPGTVTVTVSGATDGFVECRTSTGVGEGTGLQVGGAYTLVLQLGTYTCRGGSPTAGPLGEATVTVTAGGTHAITLTAPTVRTVTGRVTDQNGTNLSGAGAEFVDATSGRIMFATSTGAASGTNVSASLPSGTYRVRAGKSGYVDRSDVESLTVASGGATFTTRTLTAAGATLTPIVQTSGANASGIVRVMATDASNRVVTAEVDTAVTSGSNATLKLTEGSWSVKAFADTCVESAATTVTVTGSTALPASPTLTLSVAMSGCTPREVKLLPIAPKTGGVVRNADIGSNFEMSIPQGVLSTSDTATGSVTTREVPFTIETGTLKVIGGSAVEVTAKDSNGNTITEFASGSEGVTLRIPYTEADLAATSTSGSAVDESNLTVAAWNDATGQWEVLPSTVDAENNVIAVTTTHFTNFGVVGTSTSQGSPRFGDTVPPAAPSGVSAMVVGGAATLTWTDPVDSDLDAIEILRNTGGTTPVGGTPIARIGVGIERFVDASVVAGTTYRYIIRALDTSGNRKNSREVMFVVPRTTTLAPAPTPTTPATPSTPIVSTTPPSVPAPTSIVSPPAIVPAPQPALARKPMLVLNRPLVLGSRGADVSALQRFLARDAAAKYRGPISGYFGTLTRAAVMRFQRANRLPVVGIVGPKTRAFLLGR